MPHIFVDADACPVKREVYRVADRYQLHVTLVADCWMRIPDNGRTRMQVVDSGENAADDWIAENVQPGDIVVTADIPLASRCLQAGAHVIGTTGKPFTQKNIGAVLATRNLLADLRAGGEITGGPSPIDDRDRSRFLGELDGCVRAVQRACPDGKDSDCRGRTSS